MTDSTKTNDDNDQPKPKKASGARKIAAVIAILILLVLIVPLSNLMIAPATGTALTLSASGGFAEVAQILEKNCLDCHSEKAKLPFYATLPPAKSMVQADMAKGRRYMDMLTDLAPAQGKPVSEAALAKLEFVIDKGTMPPARYTMLHWNRGLGTAEKETIQDWITQARKEHYAVDGTADAYKDGPLQPLPKTVSLDAGKVALGEKLFHDTRLSGDDTLSCASCHALDKGGTDQAVASTGIGGVVGPINAPTVYNAGFGLKQFWDGRAADLKAQAAGPVHNPIEMGSNWGEVVPKLEADAAIVAQFAAVYPTGIIGENIVDAIAEYERSLITPNSPFDRYLRGDAGALNADQVAGYHLFLDNGCANCHVGRILGGQSFEPMGRRADYFADRGNGQEVDRGRFNVTKDERDRHRFKVPTLRNIAQTYPYLHDGTQKTLADAVSVMAKYQAYRDFSPSETQSVVKFLEALTGEYKGTMLH